MNSRPILRTAGKPWLAAALCTGGQACRAALPSPEPFLFLGIPGCVLFVLFLSVFWIWALVDCAVKEPNEGNEKVIWILIIILTHWIGALLYFFIRRPKRLAQYRR